MSKKMLEARCARKSGTRKVRKVAREVREVRASVTEFSRPSDGYNRVHGGHAPWGKPHCKPTHRVARAAGAPKVITRKGGNRGERIRMGWTDKRPRLEAGVLDDDLLDYYLVAVTEG